MHTYMIEHTAPSTRYRAIDAIINDQKNPLYATAQQWGTEVKPCGKIAVCPTIVVVCRHHSKFAGLSSTIGAAAYYLMHMCLQGAVLQCAGYPLLNGAV